MKLPALLGIIVITMTQPLLAEFSILDNFDAYTPGTNGNALTPSWLQGFTGVTGTTTTAVNSSVLASAGQGLIFTYGGTGGQMNSVTASGIAGDNATGTLFFQVGFTNFGSDCFFGVGLSGATAYAGVSAIARVINTGVLQVYNGNGAGAGTGYLSTTTPITLSLNTIYSFWMVLNNNANTYDLYYAVGGGDPLIAQAGIGFRAASAGNLNTFYAGTNTGSGYVLDNVYVDQTGANLANPAATAVPEPAVSLLLGTGALALVAFRKRRK